MSTRPSYEPSRSIPARISRRLTQWSVVKPLLRQPTRALVTFTFDDFPTSAVNNGAQILEDAGGRGTFYACTSFMGETTATGEQFTTSDIETLKRGGHEIGAHSHGHLDFAKTSIQAIDEDIQINLKRLSDLGIANVDSFAYPYGETQPGLKRALVSTFSSARGILPGRNDEGSDFMQLRAFELSEENSTIERAAKAIKAAEEVPSWIIIFTHGICPSNPAFGTTPSSLRKLVQIAQDIGADICTMKDAVRQLSLAKHD